MNKRVNFEDSLFILMMRIRMIRDTITLDVDPELFLEKILDDIYSTDNALTVLLGYLKESNRLFEREELLEQFSEAEWLFSQVLTELLSHNGNLSIQEIDPEKEKLLVFRKNSIERRRIAENLSPADSGTSGSPIVSSDEITELLKAF